MDEARLKEIEAGHEGKAGSGCVLMDLVAEVRHLQEREDAVFVKGYRHGYWNGSGAGKTAWQSEVDAAHQVWVEGGRKTHLDEER